MAGLLVGLEEQAVLVAEDHAEGAEEPSTLVARDPEISCRIVYYSIA